MILQKKKLMTNKHGTLHSVHKLVGDKFVPIILTLNNIGLLFDIQRTKNKIFLKWKLESFVDIAKLSDIEEGLVHFFGKGIVSNVITKDNYPKHVSTQIKLTKNGSSVINDEDGLDTYEEYIVKSNKYNLVIEIKNVFEKTDSLTYILNIKKISIAL